MKKDEKGGSTQKASAPSPSAKAGAAKAGEQKGPNIEMLKAKALVNAIEKDWMPILQGTFKQEDMPNHEKI